MARQFLTNSSPLDKYKLFYKGVQLEQLNQDYDLLAEYIDQMEDSFEAKQMSLGGLDTRRNDAKKLLDLVSKQDNIRAKSERLGVQMAWAQVEEQENGLAMIERELEQTTSELQDTGNLMQERTQGLLEAQQGVNAANEAKLQTQQLMYPIDAELVDATATKDDCNKEKADNHSEQRQIRSAQQAAIKAVNKTSGDIVLEEKRLEDANGASVRKRHEELAEAKEAVVRALQRQEDHGRQRTALQDSASHALETMQESNGPRDAKASEIRECRDRLHSLRREGGQQHQGYPEKMGQLRNVIFRENGFRQKPVGPIGDYIQILKPKWSSILERTFGGVLNSFIVTCRQDRDKLNALMRSTNWSVCSSAD